MKQSKFNAIKILRFKFISSLISLVLGVVILYIIYFSTFSVVSYLSFTILYYVMALAFFTYNLGVFLASLRVYFKDISEALNSVLQVLFWVTPIIWNISLIPTNYHWVIYLNPLTYIIEGVRETLNHGILFYTELDKASLFWGTNLILYIFSKYIYQRLSLKFNDVL
ncbi:ABC transporter permease [Vibrio gazogenes]|uniref:ABC transporter permease n=1 Tax=Vibrio gazogenes TaxID=687 RepID=UPI00098760E7|nr:ABC transporter permease [Vibrio gazogenes]